MRLEKIAIGRNPPDEVNVIVEVPVGGPHRFHSPHQTRTTVPGFHPQEEEGGTTMSLASAM